MYVKCMKNYDYQIMSYSYVSAYIYISYLIIKEIKLITVSTQFIELNIAIVRKTLKNAFKRYVTCVFRRGG